MEEKYEEAGAEQEKLEQQQEVSGNILDFLNEMFELEGEESVKSWIDE